MQVDLSSAEEPPGEKPSGAAKQEFILAAVPLCAGFSVTLHNAAINQKTIPF